MPKPIIIPAKEEIARHRIIRRIEILDDGLAIYIGIADIVDDVYVVDTSESSVMILILGDAYSELMSIRPIWHPTKDSEYWDERDLWYIIDEIESGNLSNEIQEEL